MKTLVAALALPLSAEPDRVGPARSARTGSHGDRRSAPSTIAAPRSTSHPGQRMARADERLDVAALYRRYGDMVYGRCLSMLRNEADAVDATQEVFLKAHRYQDGFRGNARPSTWLYRIATNQCLNMIRSRKRHPEDPVEEIQDHAPLPVADSVLDQVAQHQLVSRLLEGWDERTQQCVVYHFMDGMTQEEVGELLGISSAAVRKRLAKFRKVSQARFPTWAGWGDAP